MSFIVFCWDNWKTDKFAPPLNISKNKLNFLWINITFLYLTPYPHQNYTLPHLQLNEETTEYIDDYFILFKCFLSAHFEFAIFSIEDHTGCFVLFFFVIQIIWLHSFCYTCDNPEIGQ